MNQIQVNSITCTHCDETFTLKWQYQNHYKKKHQNEVRINERMTISRSENGKFICICGKDFELGKSLKRHYENCSKVHEKELKYEQGKIYSYYLFY